MTETVTERWITYEYGPEGMEEPFVSGRAGRYTWKELIAQIEDDRWGSNYTITHRKERTVTYTDWEEVE